MTEIQPITPPEVPNLENPLTLPEIQEKWEAALEVYGEVVKQTAIYIASNIEANPKVLPENYSEVLRNCLFVLLTLSLHFVNNPEANKDAESAQQMMKKIKHSSKEITHYISKFDNSGVTVFTSDKPLSLF